MSDADNTTPNTPAGGAVALLPCPFCGCDDISEGEVLCESPRGKFTKQNMCRKCGALGPEARVDGPDYGDVAANAAWNRPRATVPLDAVRGLMEADRALDAVLERDRLRREAGSMLRFTEEIEIARAVRNAALDELEALTRGEGK